MYGVSYKVVWSKPANPKISQDASPATALALALAYMYGADAADGPLRLTVSGAAVRSAEGPVTLRGFTFWFGDTPQLRSVTPEDRLVKALLPGANLARLVMVHWRDSNYGTKPGDCYADQPLTGFLTPSCLEMFDSAVGWAADNGLWVTLTSRAADAAGDGGPGHTVLNTKICSLSHTVPVQWAVLHVSDAGAGATSTWLLGLLVPSPQPHVGGMAPDPATAAALIVV